jgi:peptidyl-prolyl cis-trans isomerase C
VLHCDEGSVLSVEAAKSQIAAYLATAALQRGIRQYLQIRVGRARIEGISLEANATPLVQ